MRPEVATWKVPFTVCVEGTRLSWFALAPRPFEPVGVSTSFQSGVDFPRTDSKSSILTRWFVGPVFEAARLRELTFGDRFPELSAQYRGPDVVEHYRLRIGPWGGREPNGDLKLQETALLQVAEWADAHGVPVRRGWLDASVVTPERVSAPKRDGESGSTAGYRTSARVTPWTWTAPMATHERLLRWVLLRNRREWPFAVEAAIHEGTLFVRDHERDEHAWALPVSTVRARHDLGPDTVYVFGRHTQVGLFGRLDGCPVRAILDRHLEESS